MNNSYDFNTILTRHLYNPLIELDESWVVHDNRFQQLNLIHNWRGNANLNKWFSKENKFNLLDKEKFNAIGSKISLINRDDLKTILLYLGTLLHHQILNSVGFVSEKNKLISIVGEDIYKFSANQGKYLLSKWPENWEINEFNSFDYDYIIMSGLNFILSILYDCDDRVIRLLQYKIPFDYFDASLNNKKIDMYSDSNLNSAYFLVVKLSKRVNVSCYHLLK